MTEMRENKDRTEILKFLYRRRKSLFLVAIVAVIASILITALIPKKYTSSITLFPPSLNSPDQSFQAQVGYSVEADRLIQLGQSNSLKDSLDSRFDLVTYFEIDTLKPDWRTTLYKNIDNSVVFERMKNLSVEVKVTTKDPEFSARIANSIAELLSELWTRLHRENMVEMLSYAGKLYLDKNREVNLLIDSIHRLRNANRDESLSLMYKRLKVQQSQVERTMKKVNELREGSEFYDSEHQLDLLTEELIRVNRSVESEGAKLEELEHLGNASDTAIAMTKGRLKGARENEKYIRNNIGQLKNSGKRYDLLSRKLNNAIGLFHETENQYEGLLYAFEPYVRSLSLEHLESQLDIEKLALKELKERYESAYRYYNRPPSGVFVLEKARPTYRKSSPSLIFNTLFTLVIALLSTTLFLLLRLKFRELTQDSKS